MTCSYETERIEEDRVKSSDVVYDVVV